MALYRVELLGGHMGQATTPMDAFLAADSAERTAAELAGIDHPDEDNAAVGITFEAGRVLWDGEPIGTIEQVN